MNRKGVEQPQVIVYVLFVVVLTMAGIYASFTLLGGVVLVFDFQDYSSRLNTVAAKLMFTPECYAYESNYDKGGTHYQVSGGVIDWQKFNSSNVINKTCLTTDIAWAQLKDFNNKYSGKVWNCEAPPCSEPTAKDLADDKIWKQVARNYVVLIRNETSTDVGVLTVRLKS